jgi:ferredoxin-nitrite reductase
VPAARVDRVLREPLLKRFSPAPSPFIGGLVTCIGTDYCNLALIDTKGPARVLAETLERRLGNGARRLTMHWSGCQAGCGNHQAADIGFRGVRTVVDGRAVDAVAIYVGGRTGPDAAAGQQILDAVPCDDRLADVVAGLILDRQQQTPSEGDRTAPDRDAA